MENLAKPGKRGRSFPSGNDLKAASPTGGSPERGADLDLALLEANLAATPWERMLANDDALNFAETLRAAMERRSAKS